MILNLLQVAWLHLYIRVLRGIGLFYNPHVKRKIGKLDLIIPFAHELPIYLKLFPLYSRNLPRIIEQILSIKKTINIIDIGANIGDTVALIGDTSEVNILCIEGNEKYFHILTENVSSLPNVSTCRTFLGEKSELLNVVLDGSRGTGQLVTGNDQIKIETLDEVAPAYSKGRTYDLIKIDTDGFDNAIIRGAVNLISADKPVIFFEYMPDALKDKEDPEAIFSFLSGLGYNRALLYDNNGWLSADIEVGDSASVAAASARYYGFGVRKYLDVAVFHKDQAEIYKICAESEISFFKQLNKN